MDLKSSETDLVSDADRAAETAITELLLGERPDDGLLGEEGASREGTSGRRWLVDPLDGTTNYLYGLAAWAVSIALEDEAGGLVAVVHQPIAAETFRAVRGRGAELDGAPMHVRTPQERTGDADDASAADPGRGAADDPGPNALRRALIATGFSYDAGVRGRQAEALTHVIPRVRDVRRGGSAALDLAWVAAGRLDGYYERGGELWDWAAGKILVSEAGGAIAPLEGEPVGIAAAGHDALAALLELLAEADA